MDNQSEPSAEASESDVVGRRDTPRGEVAPAGGVGVRGIFDNSVDRKSRIFVDEPLREAGVVGWRRDRGRPWLGRIAVGTVAPTGSGVAATRGLGRAAFVIPVRPVRFLNPAD
jgi:hypothetical protein